MAEISFALLLNENLKLKGLPLKQVETVITITGDEDPQTLQKMREAVKDSFQARRKNLNDLVTAAYKDLGNQGGKKDKILARKKKLDQDMTAMIATFEKDLAKRIAAFCEKDQALVSKYRSGLLKWTIATLWSVGGIAMNIWTVATEGPEFSSLFEYIDTAKEILATAQDLVTACQSENTIRDKIESNLEKAKAIKPPKPIPKDLLQKIELDINVYKGKLLGVEMSTRSASKDLQKMLTNLDKSKNLRPASKAQAEKMVDTMINKIIQTNEDLEKGRRFSQSARDKIKNFEKRAKENPQTYWQLLCKLYDEARAKFLDLRGPQEFKDVADQFVKVCTADND